MAAKINKYGRRWAVMEFIWSGRGVGVFPREGLPHCGTNSTAALQSPANGFF